jgi:hypothetical protein
MAACRSSSKNTRKMNFIPKLYQWPNYGHCCFEHVAAMLDRSIHTRKTLVHSIPISEVKDMKSDVLRALKASHSEKKTLNLVCKLNFNNFQERKIT